MLTGPIITGSVPFNLKANSLTSYISSLSCSGNKYKNLHPYFITGFADAEASFCILLTQNNKYKQGWNVRLSFQITLHKKDIAVLEAIMDYFNGVGGIFKEGERDSVKYKVASIKCLNLIIEHFDKYPLITQKQADYLLFKQALELVNCKKHLTPEGLNQIVSKRAAMNNGLTEKLKKHFPNVLPETRPLVQNREILDPNWLVGFTAGEGSFLIQTAKSVSHKSGYRVLLRFAIGQHIKDAQLISNLIAYLGCGRYSESLNYAEFAVTKFSDISEIIIPFFEKYPIIGVKAKDFLCFCQAAVILSNKYHLTEKGLEEIFTLKRSMNRERVWKKEDLT